MNWHATERVMKTSHSRGAARSVLLALAHRINCDGICYPGIQRIAGDTGLTARTVQRAIRNLEALGEIEILHRGGRVNTNGGRQWTSQYRLILAGDNDDISKGMTNDTQGGVNNAAQGVTNKAKGGVRLTPQSNQKRELKLLEKRDVPEELDYGDFHDESLCPLELASRITSENDPRSTNFRRKMLREIGERNFRAALADAWGIIKCDRPDRPGAILTNKLKEYLSAPERSTQAS